MKINQMSQHPQTVARPAKTMVRCTFSLATWNVSTWCTIRWKCSFSDYPHAGITSISSVIFVPALIASHLFLSSCTLIIGFLLGSLSHRCCKKKSSNIDNKLTPSIEEPVYSEIPPKTVPSVFQASVKSVDNVAYGQISQWLLTPCLLT